MNAGRAFAAGVVGGAVMSGILAIARALGIEVNLSMMLGTMVGLSPGVGAWILGFIMHLIISGLIALLYAAAFERITHRANAGYGVLFSIVHLIIGGLAMGMVPAMHPLIPEMMAAPGIFLSGFGIIGVVAFVLLHMIYGAIVGSIYRTEAIEVRRHETAYGTTYSRA